MCGCVCVLCVRACVCVCVCLLKMSFQINDTFWKYVMHDLFVCCDVFHNVLRCVTLCCSVLQCIAVYYSHAVCCMMHSRLQERAIMQRACTAQRSPVYTYVKTQRPMFIQNNMRTLKKDPYYSKELNIHRKEAM